MDKEVDDIYVSQLSIIKKALADASIEDWYSDHLKEEYARIERCREINRKRKGDNND